MAAKFSGSRQNGTSSHPEAEEVLSVHSGSGEDALFDEVIGHIQEIIFEDEFIDLQQEFMEKHYHNFEDVEENKLIYMDIFKLYTGLVEKHIETKLTSRMPKFNMAKFMKSLESRKHEVEEGVLEMLLSLTDFLAFKQMFLDYKEDKEGEGVDLGCITVTPLSER